MGNTYGTWLPGDHRGFRTRWHREHIDGDYRSPPPKGKYDERLKKSRELMKRDPVLLTWEQRRCAVDELIKSLRKWKIEVRILSVDRIHMHVLARFPDHNPRHFLGLAKKESSAYMKQAGLAPDGGLWATKCECVPITDRPHFDKVEPYIADHERKGAALWRVPRLKSLHELDLSVFLLDDEQPERNTTSDHL
jgi:REP element-mobilizing transposase RayT